MVRGITCQCCSTWYRKWENDKETFSKSPNHQVQNSYGIKARLSYSNEDLVFSSSVAQNDSDKEKVMETSGAILLTEHKLMIIKHLRIKAIDRSKYKFGQLNLPLCCTTMSLWNMWRRSIQWTWGCRYTGSIDPRLDAFGHWLLHHGKCCLICNNVGCVDHAQGDVWFRLWSTYF